MKMFLRSPRGMLSLSLSVSLFVSFSSLGAADGVIVKVTQGTTRTQLSSQLAASNGEVIREIVPGEYYLVSGAIPDASFASYLRMTRPTAVLSAHPNVSGEWNDFDDYDPEVPNDSEFSNQWYLTNVEATHAWTFETGSTDVVVAIVDSGVNYNHADLDGVLWQNPGEIPGNGIDDDSNGFVDDVFGIDAVGGTGDPADVEGIGHGTWVAGCVTAETNNSAGIAGLGRDSRLMLFNMANATGSPDAAGAIAAIRYATDHGAAVINCSWSFLAAQVPDLRTEIERATAAGVVVVASAGNDASTVTSESNAPAVWGGDIDGLIVVGASVQTNARAWFSNTDNHVDFFAPGVAIRTSDLSGGYADVNGTSFSSPITAAAAALAISRFGDTDPTRVATRLRNSVDLFSGLSGLSSTGGRLNVRRGLSVFSLYPTTSAAHFNRDISWLGATYDGEYPYVEVIDFGWFLCDTADVETLHIDVFSYTLNTWVILSENDYPWMWRWSDAKWILYFQGTKNPAVYWVDGVGYEYHYAPF